MMNYTNYSCQENTWLEISEDSLINVDKDCTLTLLLTNEANVIINVNENVSCELLSSDSSPLSKRIINVFENAKINGILGHFGPLEATDEINLVGRHAMAEIKVVSMVSIKEKQTVFAHLYHKSPLTTGTVKVYAVSSKEGDIIIDGINQIGKGMNGSISSLNIRGLILDSNAKIAANPALLIDEFDVKANHGATVGKISDEGLYYLMSRGISKQDATLLIINGFLIPIIESIKDDKFKALFKENTEKKL